MKGKIRFWGLLIGGIVLIALGVVLLNTVLWLKINDMELGLIVLLGGMLLLIYLYISTVPTREARVYLTPEGLPDITTGRYYEAKALKFGQGFLSRGKISIPRNALQVFYVKDGKIEVTVKSGKKFSSLLSDLIVKYQMEENKVTGEAEISGYSLKNNNTGEKITIYYPGIAFEPDEWKDIAGVFSQAAVVKEAGISKVTSFVSKLKGAVEDFDFSDIAGSVVGKVTDGVTDVAVDKIVGFATGTIEKPKKGKGKLKKILRKIVFWTIIIYVVLYTIFDVWEQIEMHNMETSGYTEYPAEEYATEESATEEFAYVDPLVVESEVDESLFNLVIDWQYVVQGAVSLNELHIGNNYDEVYSDTGSTHKSLHATGAIGDDKVSVKCWLTEDGELHGRYHNENGTNLDLNGFIQPNGDLYIQLGHDSYKSVLRLHPVSDEIPGSYRYEGSWGKSGKWSYLVFFED